MASAPNQPPTPTPIFRIVHIDNLATLVARQHIHAPNAVPNDGHPWRGIHAREVQQDRGRKPVPCGPRGTINDYVGFYLGPLSPMLLRIHTWRQVEKIDQKDIVYLVSSAQAVAAARLGYAFTDRHSLAALACFYDDVAQLGRVDFMTCYAKYWNNTDQFPDRQEKKQAEFLVHRGLPWPMIDRIGVSCEATAARVRPLLAAGAHQPAVAVERGWYYW
jgi:hypothetical protein